MLSLLAILFWGMSYIWSGSLLSKGIPVEYVVFVRISIAAVFLLILNLLAGKSIRIQKRDIPKFLLVSLFEPLIYFVTETYGIQLTESPTYSSLIIASGPVLSVFVGVLAFKEKVNIVNIFGILVCLGGIVMVTMVSNTVGEAFWLGALLLVIAVLSEVGNASVTKILTTRYDPAVIVMYQFLIGSVYLLPMFLNQGLKDFDAAVYLSWDAWYPVLCLAILCSGVAFSLWANTIKHLGVAKSSIFMSTIPVVTALAGWILGSEVLSLKQWIGIFLATLGVGLSQLNIRSGLFKCKRKS
ncbi:MAG: DMT family transporter [Candidatus Cryptobacteroides sp.]